MGLNIRSVAPRKKQSPSTAAPEEIDALSEAELFLNFGRDVQAEEVLKDALASNPDNIPVQLKLLSIYANRKDANGFSSIARKVKDSGDAEAWQKAAMLGYSIDPTNPMYEDGKSAAEASSEMLSESGKSLAAVPLDMDVGFDIPMDLDVTAAMPEAGEHQAQGAASEFDVSIYDTSAPMDLDVTGSHPNVTGGGLLPDFDVTGGHALAAPSGATDFDVTGGHPDLGDTQHMDFDVTGAFPGVDEGASAMDFGAAATSEPESPGLGLGFDVSAGGAPSGGMDFDIGSTSGAEPESAGLGGLSFDVSAPAEPEAPLEEAPAEQASSDFGGLAFDLGDSSLSTESVESTQVNVPQSAGIGGMDFDVSALSEPETPAEETPAEQESSDLDGLAFDLSGLESSPTESVETTQVNVPKTAGTGGMDFDISAAPEPAATDKGATGAEEFSAVEGLAFDLSGSLASVETTQVNVSESSGGHGTDFDISAAQSEPSAFEASSGGLDFDISASQPEAGTGPEADLVNTIVLDGATDFDISAPLDSTAALEPHADTADNADADFDLGAASSLVVPNAGEEMASLAGGMDLDLGASAGTESAAGLGMDFDISASHEAEPSGQGLGAISLDMGGEPAVTGDEDAGAEVENKLELARAFQEMGDADTARELLGEVVKEGNPRQIESAQQLIQQL